MTPKTFKQRIVKAVNLARIEEDSDNDANQKEQFEKGKTKIANTRAGRKSRKTNLFHLSSHKKEKPALKIKEDLYPKSDIKKLNLQINAGLGSLQVIQEDEKIKHELKETKLDHVDVNEIRDESIKAPHTRKSVTFAEEMPYKNLTVERVIPLAKHRRIQLLLIIACGIIILLSILFLSLQLHQFIK